MIGVDVNSLPYQQKISYQMIKYLRLCRNMTQTQFGDVCKVDQGVLAKLERGDLPLSPHYETKILEGCKALNISELELVSVKRIVELKQNRGIN
ncbi:helix-turn-helix domain-containing protein [Bacillus cereus]|uniref:helix-turn-helix domain-containing protein n=1 Tax=Bacillus cereus TaxID=1396 RepID=UPI0035C97FAA